MKPSYVKRNSPPKLYLDMGMSYSSNQQCYHSNYNTEFQKKLTKLNNKLESNDEVISNLSEQVIEFQRNQTKLNNKLESKNEMISNLSEQVIEFQRNQTKLNNKLESKNEISNLSEQVIEFQRNQTKLNNKLESNNEIIFILSEQVIEFQRKLKELSDGLDNNNKTIPMFSKQLNVCLERFQEIKRQFTKYDSILSEELSTRNEMFQYPFISILKMLPSNYPLQSVYVNGKKESVTKFLSLNNQDKLVFFLDNENVKTFECSTIDGIVWGDE
ncbi:hypothetical protein ACIQXU_12435 [Peribacillus sp. NPDC097284]|uniref:hypothetical protein n=1 Tax=Peribacillus sp. NPDC097284 TaxID=3364401 RepID=UPI00380E2BE0